MVVTAALAGKRIVVTRATEQADSLCALIERAEGIAVRLPMIQVKTVLADGIDRTVSHLDTFDWIILTSVNGVRSLKEALHGQPLPTGVSVAVVGSATRAAARETGWSVTLMPDDFVGSAIPDAMGEVGGLKILLARGNKAGPDLARALEARGGHVTDLCVYKTLPVVHTADTLSVLRDGVDAVTFTSGSTTQHFVAEVPEALQLLADVEVFCIGPVTADIAQAMGIRVTAVGSPHTAAGLVAAMEQHFGQGVS